MDNEVPVADNVEQHKNSEASAPVNATTSARSSTSTQHPPWIFRDPQTDPLEVALQYKVMALSEISNAQQTFTMTIMEDIAIWLTRDEYDDYLELSRSRQVGQFRPQHILHTYVYNSTDSSWQEANQTLEGCDYHIRCLDVEENNNKCWAWRQRLGKVTFNQPFQLRNFPFDVQDLTCMFALFVYTNQQSAQRLRILPLNGGATFSAKFVEPNDEYQVCRDHHAFHCLHRGYVSCTYKICREWKYYFSNVMVVLSIVTLTALAAFVSFESYMEQISHLSTVLLTDVAYLYTIQNHMPKLKYLTLLDYFVFMNVVFVFLIYIQLTVFQKLDMDMSELVGRGTRLTVADAVLVANLVVWVMLVSIFSIVAARARLQELKKLTMPKPAEGKSASPPFECNAFCGGSSRCLMLG